MPISRLEAATSRLEDLAIAGASAPHAAPTGPASAAKATASTAAPLPPPPPPPPLVEGNLRSVEAFDENVVKGKLVPFVELTKSFASPLVIDQVSILVVLNEAKSDELVRSPM